VHCLRSVQATRPIDDPRHRSPDGSSPWVFTCRKTLDSRLACYAVGGAIFSNQFQSRRFVGTGSDALPVSVHDPLMADFLDCIFCHCGPTTVRPPAGSAFTPELACDFVNGQTKATASRSWQLLLLDRRDGRSMPAGFLLHRSRASSRLPQCFSFRDGSNTRSTCRFRALITPIRANMVGPPRSATSMSASIAACHSGCADSFSGSPVV
jgi:hypothetical protein